MSTSNPIQTRIEQLHKIDEAIKSLRGDLRTAPELFNADIALELKKLWEEFANRLSEDPPRNGNETQDASVSAVIRVPKKDSKPMGVRGRMISFLVSLGNKPVTIPQFVLGTEAKEDSVKNILYKLNEGEFLFVGKVRSASGSALLLGSCHLTVLRGIGLIVVD